MILKSKDKCFIKESLEMIIVIEFEKHIIDVDILDIIVNKFSN